MNYPNLFFSLFLGVMLYGSLFANENQLQFEIVPFDYADVNMKEQICAMVRDDQDMQRTLNHTEQSMRECLSRDNGKEWSILVCRTVDNPMIILGYMHYVQADRIDYLDHPVMGKTFCFHMNNDVVTNYHTSFVILDTIKSVGYINGLAVHKNYRGCGIAQAFLSCFEVNCKNNGMQHLMLSVQRDNEKAIRAYHKFGFDKSEMYNSQVGRDLMMKKLN